MLQDGDGAKYRLWSHTFHSPSKSLPRSPLTSLYLTHDKGIRIQALFDESTPSQPEKSGLYSKVEIPSAPFFQKSNFVLLPETQH